MALKIEKIISGAYGLSHDEDGRAVLVKSALPSEIIEPVKVEKKANTLIVEEYEILEESPMRISPPCPYYGLCGGCDFLIVSESDSAYLKETMVRENLERIASIKDVPFLPPAYSSFLSYRSRCRFHVDLRLKEIGFLKRNSNELLPIRECPALSERINLALHDKAAILKEAQRRRILYGQNKKTGFVEVPLQDGDVELAIGEKSVTALGYEINTSCFFQSNLHLLPSLLSFVKENATGSVMMDLYSGVGTFSRLFDDRETYAVEKNAACLPLARRNAPKAKSFTDDALLFARKVCKAVNTVIVDPPRTGLDGGVIPLILSWKAERIIYVSCDSTTASRDLRLFTGYEIIKAMLFDFYPGSYHEECAFVLERM